MLAFVRHPYVTEGARHVVLHVVICCVCTSESESAARTGADHVVISCVCTSESESAARTGADVCLSCCVARCDLLYVY